MNTFALFPRRRKTVGIFFFLTLFRYPIVMGFGDSNLKYSVGLSQFKKLVLITMFEVAKNRKDKL